MVTINRPEVLNALDGETLSSLRDLLGGSPRTGGQVGVLTGAGDGPSSRSGHPGHGRLDCSGPGSWAQLGQMLACSSRMPKPTIAAINGVALGGGCELVLACDIRLGRQARSSASRRSTSGSSLGWGGTQRLARVCGLGVAKELILTGRLVDADEALRIGLVNAVYEPRTCSSERWRPRG